MASPSGLASTAAASIQAASGTERAGEPRGSFLDVARSGGSEVFRFATVAVVLASASAALSSSSSFAVTSTTLALSVGGIAPRATSHDVRLAAIRLLLLLLPGAEENVATEEEEEDDDDDVDGGSIRRRRRHCIKLFPFA